MAGPVPTPARLAIARALHNGQSATSALRDFRKSGGSMRTQTFYRLYGQAQVEGIHRYDEASRPLNRTPTPDEIQTMTVRRGGGFLHKVVVMTKDASGQIISRTLNITRKTPMTRGNAIRKAMSIVADNRDSYGLEPVAAFHTGVFEMVRED